jgi:RNA polymerase sigma factor (sigma-70 family)
MSKGDPLPPVSLAELWKNCRKNADNARAWEQLFACLLPILSSVVSRVIYRFGDRNYADLDDLLQDISLKIFQRTKSASDLPEDDRVLTAYFKVLAANTARDWARSRFADKRNSDATVSLEDKMELLKNTLGAKASAEREALLCQVDDLLKATPRDRSVFWLHYRHGLTAAEIAAIPAVGLSVKGVESLIHRMTTDLRSKVG